MVEPPKALLMRRGLAVARCMVNTSCATIPIRMYNPSDNDVHVWRCMTVGLLEPVLGHKRCPPTKTIRNVTTSKNESSTVSLPEHLQDLYERSLPTIPAEDGPMVKQLLADNADVFARSSTDLGRTKLVKHIVDTGQEQPFQERVRRFPYEQTKEIEKQVRTMQEQGIIQESNSPWASNVVLVKKKDQTWRMCVDYRR